MFQLAVRVLQVIATLCVMAPVVQAQTFPDRPITLFVPYAAGGPLDLTARVLGEHMTKTLGQPVVVENITGGGGRIATARLAKAAPNGYTLMVHQTALAANVSLFPADSVDVETALMGVSRLNESPIFILAANAINVKSMPELVKWMKARDGKIRFGHAGVGTLSHLCAALFANAVGVNATMIPYRGGTPAIADTMAGHTDLYCSSAQLAIPQVQAGKLVGIAVTSDQRMGLVKDVPTTAEVGFPGVKAVFWQAMFAPAGMPKPILDKINGAVRDALADPTVQKRFEAAGMLASQLSDQTPAATNALLRNEIKKWAEVIRANNIQATSQ